MAADEISLLCLEQFKAIPKRGSLGPGEWTILAGIVAEDESGLMRCLSLATGTKCLGASQLRNDGLVVNDCHAEVVARRALIRYLQVEICHILDGELGKTLVLEPSKKKSGLFAIKPNIKLHMYISQAPCGDASIFLKSDEENVVLDSETKRQRLNDASSSKKKDIYRTGAKPTDGEAGDPLLPGVDYHVKGVLRTKPGRGDRTHSMSCSDKIAMWNVVGIQGCLLAQLLESPLYLSSIVVSDLFDSEALNRALWKRLGSLGDLPDGYRVNVPKLLPTQYRFEFSKANVQQQQNQGEKVRPNGNARAWCFSGFQEIIIAHHGWKHGTTTKIMGTVRAMSELCPFAMVQRFCSYAAVTGLSNRLGMTYKELKLVPCEYQRAKKLVLEKPFKNWSKKGEESNSFKIEMNEEGFHRLQLVMRKPKEQEDATTTTTTTTTTTINKN